MSKDFFDAIRSGDRERVSEMVGDDEALLRATDVNGLSPFIVAKYSGRDEIAAMLLDKGVEKGVELDLFAACMAGAGQRVAELIKNDRELIKSYSKDG
jgi:hypothetical protein